MPSHQRWTRSEGAIVIIIYEWLNAMPVVCMRERESESEDTLGGHYNYISANLDLVREEAPSECTSQVGTRTCCPEDTWCS